ncbi:hypothetical protein KEM52_005554 [Ascosphaera acerosa]|nr:hypothetical protein KEM52_005554 [Ascosphaera acerosa]
MQLGLQSLALLVALINGSSCLQPSDLSPGTPLQQLLSTAKAHLASGSPSDALVYFDEAISRDPSNYLTIFQRGAAYLSVGKNARALADFDRALELKPKFEGALLQRGRLRAKGGSWDDARKDLKAAGQKAAAELAELEAARKAAQAAQKAEGKSDWTKCVQQASVAIEQAPLSLELRQRRARCALEEGDVEAGIRDLSQVAQLATGSVEPYLTTSSTLFYSLAQRDRAIDEARKCLRSDPDSKLCSRLMRREKNIVKAMGQAQEHLQGKQYGRAIEVLLGKGKDGDAGLLDTIKEEEQEARTAGYIHGKAPSRLYTLALDVTCQALRESKSKARANTYCEELLQREPHARQGLLHRAERQIDADSFEDAIRTLNEAREHHDQRGNDREIHQLLQKAQMLLRRSKEKDYYKVLEIDRDADAQTIKRAYRRLSKMHHPDRAAASGVPKETAEKKMAELNEAYEVLSDPELKARFDRGEDPNDPHAQGHPPGGGAHFFQGGFPFGQARGGPGGQQQFFFQQHQGGARGQGGKQQQFRFQFQGGHPFQGFPGFF